jgi:large subunit ribosomal protein L22
MEIEAKLKYARISAKKVRSVARILKGKSALDAVATMQCVAGKSTRLLGAVLKSAIANAENNANLAASTLVVNSVIVEEGPVLKRFIPVSRGSAHPIRKRMSHVRVILVTKDERKN